MPDDDDGSLPVPDWNDTEAFPELEEPDEYWCDGCEERGIEKQITDDRLHQRGEEDYYLCGSCYVDLCSEQKPAYQQLDLAPCVAPCDVLDQVFTSPTITPGWTKGGQCALHKVAEIERSIMRGSGSVETLWYHEGEFVEDCPFRQRGTALWYSVLAQDHGCASRLINLGSNVDTSGQLLLILNTSCGHRFSDTTPLWQACIQRDLGMVKLLLQHGASIHHQGMSVSGCPCEETMYTYRQGTPLWAMLSCVEGLHLSLQDDDDDDDDEPKCSCEECGSDIRAHYFVEIGKEDSALCPSCFFDFEEERRQGYRPCDPSPDSCVALEAITQLLVQSNASLTIPSGQVQKGDMQYNALSLPSGGWNQDLFEDSALWGAVCLTECCVSRPTDFRTAVSHPVDHYRGTYPLSVTPFISLCAVSAELPIAVGCTTSFPGPVLGLPSSPLQALSETRNIELLPALMQLALTESIHQPVFQALSPDAPFTALATATRGLNHKQAEMRHSWARMFSLSGLGRAVFRDVWAQSELAQEVMGQPSLMQLIISFAQPWLCAQCGNRAVGGYHDAYNLFRCNACAFESIPHPNEVVDICCAHGNGDGNFTIELQRQDPTTLQVYVSFKDGCAQMSSKQRSVNGISFCSSGELVWMGSNLLAARLSTRVIKVATYVTRSNWWRHLEGNYAGTVLVRLPSSPEIDPPEMTLYDSPLNAQYI